MSQDPQNSIQLMQSFFTEVGIISQLSNTALSRALPKGMTLAQFGVLTHFSRLGGAWTPARLAAAFQVTKGAMTNTLQRLQAKQHIAIERDPNDGRRKLVTITDAGLAALQEAVALVVPPMVRMSGNFDAKDFENALPFLQRVRQYLDEARNGDG